jgi:hypothetical protein
MCWLLPSYSAGVGLRLKEGESKNWENALFFGGVQKRLPQDLLVSCDVENIARRSTAGVWVSYDELRVHVICLSRYVIRKPSSVGEELKKCH